MADWLGSIVQLGNTGAGIYNTVKTGQNEHDILSQVGTDNARQREYNLYHTDQVTAATKSLIVYVAVALLVIIIAVMPLKN